MSPRLRCKLVSDLDVLNDRDDNKRTIWLTPDNDKRTSFTIDKAIEDSLKEAPKPCFLVIDCYHKDSGGTVPFFYGGMDMISNSRNIESYALGQDKDNYVPSSKNLGEYWQTHQGSKRDDDTSSECMKEFYQCIILPPSSKPLTIKCLTLKLLSLRPAKCNVGYVKQIKIKAKLPDVNDTAISTSNSKGEGISNGGNEHRSQHAQSQPMETIVDSIQDQIPHAIRALTVMIESVRNSVEASASNALGEIEKKAFAKDQQNGLMMHSIQNSLNDLKDSVSELTNEIRLLRNQEEQRIKSRLVHDELADVNVAKEKESFQALIKEERKQIMEEIKMQQETFFKQIISRFEFRPKDQEVSKSQEIQAEECNLTQSSSEDASCNLIVEE
jgi:hypothetical protein